MPAAMHRTHPVTSGPFCIAYDNTRPMVEVCGQTPETSQCTFVGWDVTCPACLATYEPGGDDPATLMRP